jgi:hypothetical protein
MHRKIKYTEFWLENQMERDLLEDKHINGTYKTVGLEDLVVGLD